MALAVGAASPAYAEGLEQVKDSGQSRAPANIVASPSFAISFTTGGGSIKLNGARAQVLDGELLLVSDAGQKLEVLPEGFVGANGTKVQFLFDISDPRDISFRLVRPSKNRHDSWCSVYEYNDDLQALRDTLMNGQTGAEIGGEVGPIIGAFTGPGLSLSPFLGQFIGGVIGGGGTLVAYFTGAYKVRRLLGC